MVSLAYPLYPCTVSIYAPKLNLPPLLQQPRLGHQRLYNDQNAEIREAQTSTDLVLRFM